MVFKFINVGLTLSLCQIQVGTKVAAASRKTNTTTHEVLGVLTKGDTQVVSFLCYICCIYTLLVMVKFGD